MSVRFFRILCTAAVITGAVSAQAAFRTAQVPTGQTSWSCGDAYYVAVTGNNASNGSLAAPWRTVTFAIAQALTLTPAGNPISINLRAGSYSAGELFPIQLPARGIKLEAYEPGVTIFGQPNAPVLEVNRPGTQAGPCGATPDTVIRGMTVRNGIVGISIDPSMMGGTANLPDRVRVQRCVIRNNFATGIGIITGTGRLSQHLIEENEIAFNANSQGFGRGISGGHSGTSTDLIRQNNIHDNEVGIEIQGTSATNVRPRIVSNFVRDAEWGIALLNCSSYLVNNTQGYGRPFSPNQDVRGVYLVGPGQHTVANNIMWNPPGYAAGASSVTDYDLSNFSGTTVGATNWILSVVGIANAPVFVAPPADLHLQQTSPLIDAGTNLYVLPQINFVAGSLSTRADVGPDVDGDSRVLDFGQDGSPDVEIGADELTSGSGSVVRLSSPQVDAFGNVITGGVATTINLQLATQPFGRCLVYLWTPSTAQDPITQNTFQSPFGNWRIMTGAPTANRIGFGVADAAGLFQLSLTLDPAMLGVESELYVQALSVNANATRGTISNRLMVEINQ